MPLPRRARLLLAIAAALLAAYAVAGFLIAPRVIRGRLQSQLAATLHRPAAVGRVRVNPFSLTVRVDSVRVADRDGATLLSWDEFLIDFQIISLLRRELDFAEVSLVRPYARVVIRADGTMNVSDIIDSMQAAPKPANPAPLPVLAIGDLHIDGARVDFLDSAAARPFATTVGPWRIDLRAFATRRDNSSRYSFSGRTESGESFAWAGTFAIDPIRSTGEITLDSVRLAKYGPFYERTVGFDVVDGIAGVKAKYALDLTPRARVMRLLEGGMRVDGLAFLVRGLADTAVVLRRLEIGGVEADAVAHRATVGSIAATGGRISVRRAKDGTINLVRMAAAGVAARAGNAPPAPQPAAAPAAPAAPAAAPSSPTEPWHWLLAHVAVDSTDVGILDSAAGRPARLALTGVSAAVDSVGSDSATRSRVRASLVWEGRGTFTAQGTIAIWRRRGDLAFSARDLSLRPLDAYLAPRMNLQISDGRLGADLRVRFDAADTLRPDVGVTGSVSVDRFATVDGARHEPFFGFQRFRMDGIDYGMRARKLAIRAIALDRPALDIGVAADGTPVTRIVFPNAAADSADSAAARAARGDTVAHADSVAHAGDIARPAAAPPPAPAARPGAAPIPFRASIGGIAVTGGAIRVTDRSIQPPVALTITALDAKTGRLSTDSIGVGTLDLSAMIDDVAPLRITGRFNPLSEREGSDLVVDLQGMEMVPVGPYSGKYLGYLIATGKLKIAMQYRVVGRKLQSENKLTLDGFEFGDKTDSKDATSMPVKLAFSVMRDRSGQIVFDVPVEGDLDDPSFRLGRVIGRAIMNVLTKLVTSPFKLLGGMFGGGAADLSYVQFAPGSDTLAAAERKKLDVLATSLYQRPALTMQIAGAVDTAADPAALRLAKLDARLRTRRWTALKARDANAPPPDSIRLTPDERAALLGAAYAEAFPGDSAVIASRKSKSPLPYPAAAMEQRLAATIALSPEDLQLLAAARAKRCLDYLLTVPANRIEPERVLLTGGAMRTDGARAEFTLQ
ncbi:MAG TPA: DUF748 domain-containing protein [Gemmatimonadaceae bacterium]|nr:DUF748 domain-containing protein [Gemmatimonadaceae bacterium]